MVDVNRPRSARRTAATAIGGSVALAIVAGSLMGATAANADAVTDPSTCVPTTGTGELIGTGSALVNVGSTNGLLGVGTSNGLSVGLLNCGITANVGGTAPTTTPTTTPTTPTGTTPTITPTTPTGTTPTGTPTTTPTGTTQTSTSSTSTTSSTSSTSTTSTTTGTTSTSPSGESTTTAPVSTVAVGATTTTVYPKAAGYKDKVTFSIKGLSSAKGAVKIVGTAVLKKGTKVVKTWKIDGSTSKISWNGRIGSKVVPGTYRLTVTGTSVNGTKKVSTFTVKVSSKHFVTRTAVARSVLKASSLRAKMPAAVAKAFKYGKVTAKVKTVAVVRGPAKLVFSQKGVQRTIVLKNGTHTTKALAVPKKFTSVTVKHVWKKGAAKLVSYVTTWRYRVLV